MTFGENARLVEEVLVFANGPELLQGDPPDSSSWIVIRDLSEAKSIAWEATIGSEEFLWTDIRELQMSTVEGTSYSHPNHIAIGDALFESFFGPLLRRLERRLDKQHKA